MKRITAKIDTYEKDGETKGKYVDIGVILSNDNGEYILLNPTIDLSGVLMRQRVLAAAEQKKGGNSVMCSVWDNDNQKQQQPAQQQGGGHIDDEIPFAAYESGSVI